MYKSKVPLPAMVDEFQKKYEAFKIPLPDDTVSASIDAEEKKAVSSPTYVILIHSTIQ